MLAVVEPILGATLMTGFAGLVSQAGFASDAAVEAMNAGSSIEHEMSLGSAGVVACFGRV